ncbi:flagellar basal-body MS-ring/collar protein FliF [Caulobacter segnis]|uniref:flagellar basal-body MS-ring/collar protein FliF n=1 Tax=Caulobacter segnis TaxID=88688 RepID=UPI00240EAE95|nr:flagellar basal-body MS-ring/collar protein FliF [Caulobacter segnis]MDG2520879.1 flagellar basal-body MS-ring/collar protein FliF [Caulobacter segnis]
MEKFTGAIQKFGIGRLATLIGVGAGVAAALIAIVMMVTREPESLLYSNLDLKEASEVTSALDQAGVKYSLKGDGSTIMVARDKVASTRLLISGKGLVTSGSVGYEIFDSNNVLGQTDFVQQLNRQRALEGELARTIRALDGVSSVRVHLNLPKRQLFEEDAERPSAAVTIGVGARGPSADMVRAVQNLVAGAVPNLQANAVTVIDQHGKTLSEGGDGLGGKMADDRKSEVEARIAKTVKELVEGVVGAGNVRVNVSADLNLNRVTLQEERFDPEGQVIRSESTNEQTAEERRQEESVGATAASNIPGQQGQNGFQALGSNSRGADSVTNYEISKTMRTEVVEPGQIRKISVAVAVDGVTAPPGENGEPGAYTPRNAEEMQRIQELVRAAVGYDQNRGDQLNVVNVRFARDPGEGVTAASPLNGFDKNDIMRAVELGVLGVVAALLIFFVIRPMMKPKAALTPGQNLAAIAADGAQPMVTRLVTMPDGGTQMIQVPAEEDALALPGPQSEFDQRIDIAKIEGQVKASSIKRVSEFVEKHPEESVAILRSWLHESN